MTAPVRDALLLGILQGISEWLPVSSSGHLRILQKFLRTESGFDFAVFLHFPTLLVMLICFRTDVLRILKVLLRPRRDDPDLRLAGYVLAGSAATGVVAYFLLPLHRAGLLDHPFVLPFCFLFTAVLLFVSRAGPESAGVNGTRALFAGFLQGIALFPGVSRSGATIAAARIAGVPREEAFRFSFLLAIPATLAALILETPAMTPMDPVAMTAGFLSCAAVSFCILRLLKKIVLKNRLFWFGYYCIALSALSFLLALRG